MILITLFSFQWVILPTFSLSGPLVDHTQDDLASCVPSRPLLVRLACLGKGEHRLDDRPHPSLINQFPYLDQLLAVGFHHKPDKAHVMSLYHVGRGWGTDDGDKQSSWFDHLPGALQGVATNRIEDEITA